MATLRLRVNGEVRDVDAEPAEPLLWVLRDVLGLTGTKYGCGVGHCGACTIHLNGVAIRSCVLPVAGAVGAEITTIEGLEKTVDGEVRLHPVQEAFVAHQVPQCGWCMCGQVMAAAAFLAANPRPTAEEIDHVMGGNLCRCGAYGRIRAAVAEAAVRGG